MTSLQRCSSSWRMQSLTSFKTASLLVITARNPLVNSCVRLFSKTSSFKSSKFGDAGPSFEERVELTAELGVYWKVTLLVAGVSGVCWTAFEFEVFLFEFLSKWICAAFAECEWFVRRFKAESEMIYFLGCWGTCCMCVTDAVKVLWLAVLWICIYLNCCNCVTNAGNCCNRQILIIFVCNFCFWFGSREMYSTSPIFAPGICSMLKSKGNSRSTQPTQRVKRLL